MMRMTTVNAIKLAYNHPYIGALICRSISCSPTHAAMDTKEDPEFDEETFQAPKGPIRVDSERMAEFKKKMKEDMVATDFNRYNLMVTKENDPLPPWPNNVNPHTGEVGGPKGPEPTRYGDWERKGICVDF
ncbi:succinate dehydrogenase assembly factor 4, mitochondrial-like [Pectinophora gossypiella]|uniref:succinate dehydrogenase assembly factor 4, mitochondrial-like n=1 Tax=Pectinophora gossypiella TaxID=13191 RepID=UPI00214F035B|nr:succinate dehydrogenase assembly factor 4, mitochondrial-like [Pectinophora gossypiella]